MTIKRLFTGPLVVLVHVVCSASGVYGDDGLAERIPLDDTRVISVERTSTWCGARALWFIARGYGLPIELDGCNRPSALCCECQAWWQEAAEGLG